MAKDPAFLFYPGDFLSGTMFFTDEQVGKYIRLLCAQHQHGHLTDRQILMICKTYDQDIMSKFIKDEAGLFYNAKLEDEINKRKTYTESRRNNRISKKEPNSTTYDKHMNNHMTEHMENENENRNENINRDKTESKKAAQFHITMPFSTDHFIGCWELWKDYKAREHKFKYKTPQSEQASLMQLVKLSDGLETTAIKIIEQSMANGWKGFFELKTNTYGNTKNNQTGTNHVTDEQLHESLIKRFGGR